jgi:hypothetical protein
MKTTFQNFRITATYKGDKVSPWSQEDERTPDNWNNHTVTVYNTEIRKRTSFEFWASIMNPEIRTPAEVLEAFECFVSDALAGDQSFTDFCADMGYDTDSRQAERTWKACIRSWKKLNRISNVDIFDLANDLREHLEELQRMTKIENAKFTGSTWMDEMLFDASVEGLPRDWNAFSQMLANANDPAFPAFETEEETDAAYDSAWETMQRFIENQN